MRRTMRDNNWTIPCPETYDVTVTRVVIMSQLTVRITECLAMTVSNGLYLLCEVTPLRFLLMWITLFLQNG